MKKYKILWCVIALTLNSQVWAYGSSSSTKACSKPKFTEFSPSDKASVAAKSEFSFVVSTDTNPDSINVTVKDVATALTITPTPTGSFFVTSTLPETIKDTFARINITAESRNKCKGTGGWLVKIGS